MRTSCRVTSAITATYEMPTRSRVCDGSKSLNTAACRADLQHYYLVSLRVFLSLNADDRNGADRGKEDERDEDEDDYGEDVDFDEDYSQPPRRPPPHGGTSFLACNARDYNGRLLSRQSSRAARPSRRARRSTGTTRTSGTTRTRPTASPTGRPS